MKGSSMSKTLKRLYRRLVPKATRDHVAVYAKASVAASAGVLQAVNLLAPAYNDQAQAIVGVVLAATTWLGVRQTSNRRAR